MFKLAFLSIQRKYIDCFKMSPTAIFDKKTGIYTVGHKKEPLLFSR